MKQTKHILLIAALLLGTLMASAYDFEVGGIYYNITSPTDLTVAVTYSGGSYDSVSDEYCGAVAIPSTVTYNNNTYSVTSIGMYAFCSCRNLTSITLPASVTSIEEEAFSYCSSLTSIIVADGNPIFDSRDGCNAIIGTKSNTLIVGCASTIIPEGVTCIGSGAFAYCSNLTSITIPESVTSIEDFAFIGCSNLAEITIPENSQLTSIDIYAFTNTAWNNNLPNGVIYLGKVLYKYKGTMPANTSIEVEKGTKGIAAWAFQNCSNLTSITIPESVTSIGYQALSGTAWFNNQPDGVVYLGKVLYSYKGTMPANTSIEVKDGTTCIAGNAFYGCKNLTSITIPESVTSIERLTFSGCSSLTAIALPEGVTSIGSQPFSGCSSLTAITIPKSVTRIGFNAFFGCSSLTSITIPENMESIGFKAFYGCKNLKTVINYSDLTLRKGSSSNGYVGYSAESVINIDKTEVDADGYLFKTIDGVPCLIGYFGDDTELTLPDTYKGENYRIAESAFSGCSGLTSITIPEGVTSIGEGAFRNCSSLTSITCMAATPPTIGNQFTFMNVKRSIPVYVPKGSVAAYQAANYWSEFTNIQPIPSSNIDSGTCGDNLTWELTDEYELIIEGTGDMYGYGWEGSPWFKYGSDITKVAIPKGVTSIGEGIFWDCTGLTEITIPEGVINIGNYAFAGCCNLTSVTVPESVNSIGVYAFQNCESLTAIDIPDGVTSIGSCTFENCKSLASITIPASVTSIGGNAFFCCSGLASITCEATIPPVIENVWSLWDVDKSITVYVPKGSAAAYKSAEYWSDFSTFRGIGSIDVCATPAISYAEGQVSLACATEGAEVKTNVMLDNAAEYIDLKFDFIPTVTFSAYATKELYDDSEVVILTLCWIPCDGQHMPTDATFIPSQPVLIQCANGILTLTGLTDGTKVAIYDTAGQQLGAATASNGAATITTSLATGNVAIVKIGGNSIKVVIK